MTDKIIRSSCFQTGAILDSVQQQLEKPVDQNIFTMLMQKLDSVQTCDNSLLQQQIVSLYGRVVEEFNNYIRNKVNEIARLSLDPSADSSSLRAQIIAFRTLPGVYQENLASLVLLDRQLQNRASLLQEVSVPSILPEEVEDLFELADSIFYERGEKTIHEALNRVPSITRRKLLEELSSFNLSSIEQKKQLLQSLFFFIYQLSGKTLFISHSWKDICAFFREKERVLKKEDPLHSAHKCVALFALRA